MVTPHTYRTLHSETKTTNSIYGDYYAVHQKKKIPVQPELLKILQFVDSNRTEILEDFNEIIPIKSISVNAKYAGEMVRMVKMIEAWMTKLGATFECYNIGTHKIDGEQVTLPHVILGTIKSPTATKTLCIYGGYDVKKPVRSCWETNPWTLTETVKEIFGNGVAQTKGPLLCWFQALLTFKQENIALPISIKFIIEGMYYNRSRGLREFLMTQKQTFLNELDYVVVCDSEWLTLKYPCLSYGVVGILHFVVTVSQNQQSKNDPKEDLIKIFEKLADNDKVLIPDWEKNMLQVNPDEEHLYEEIAFDMMEVRKTLPPEMRDWNQTRLLMHFWRKPTILVGDVEECTCDKKDFTVMKRKFVLKIVPRQVADICIAEVKTFIKEVVNELEIKNTVQVQLISQSRPWLEDSSSIIYEAARRATIQIYKEDPSKIREDRDSPAINVLQMLEKPILLLPLGAKGSNGGRENENMLKRNFYEAIKLIAAFILQLAELSV